jgi:streptogramin lyase
MFGISGLGRGVCSAAICLVFASATSGSEAKLYYAGQPANGQPGLIYELDPDGLTVTRTLPTPAGLHFTDALAFDGTYLWLSDQDTRDVFQIDAVTGQPVSTRQYPGPTRDMGAAYKDGHLFFSDAISPGKIVEVDPATFTMVRTGDSPCVANGLAPWGDDLLLGDNTSIGVIDGSTFEWKTFVAWSGGGPVLGVAAVDGRIFASVNYAAYKIALKEFSLSGQVLQSVDVTSWGLGGGLDGGRLVPEPATLTLVVLGGLAALRRRK